MLIPTAQRNAGLIAVSLCLLLGALPGPAAAQTPAAAPTPNNVQHINVKVSDRTTTPPKPKPAVKLPPNIVAMVNGKPITRDQVLSLFDMVHGKPLVDTLIRNQIFEDEARRLGVTVSASELQAAIKEAKDRIVQQEMQSGRPPMTFDEIAAQQGYTADLVEWSVYIDTLQHKEFLKDVESQIPSLAGQIKVAHILIATIPLGNQGQEVKPTTAADQAAKDAAAKTKIDGILADIKAGKITFEDAAKQYSDDKSNSSDGGALPFAARGTFDPSFEQAAFGIQKVGDVAGPVKSQFGWHLIKLIANGKDASPAEMKAYHDEQLAAITKNTQAMTYWVNQLMRKSQIVVNPNPVIVPNAVSPIKSLNLPAAPATKVGAK